MKRVIQRDYKERGKTIKQAEKDFLRSWEIYHKKFKNKRFKKNAKEIVITNKNDINQILKKFNINF